MQGSDSESTFESTLERKKELGGVFSPLWAQAARRATNHSFGVKNTHSVEFRIRQRKGDSKVDTLAVATEQINTLYPDCSVDISPLRIFGTPGLTGCLFTHS